MCFDADAHPPELPPSLAGGRPCTGPTGQLQVIAVRGGCAGLPPADWPSSNAAASAAEISIVVAQNKLVCFIRDNGVGMSENKNSNFGNGLRNMKQRIAETGGNLMIYSEPGKGTRIEFEVPF